MGKSNKFNTETYNEIIKILGNDDFDDYHVAVIFEDFGDTSIDYLIKILEEEKDKIIFANAIYTLGEITDSSKLMPSNISLDDYYEERDELFKLLSPSINYLIKALENKDENVRDNAAYTLEVMAECNVDGIESAFNFFVRALEDKSRLVRLNVASAIGHVADNIPENNKDYAIKPLIKLLEDKDEIVREFGAEALGKIGREKAIEPLLKMMRTKDELVYDAVATALENISQKTKSKMIYENFTKIPLSGLNKFKEVLEDNLEDIWDGKKTELLKYINRLIKKIKLKN